MNKATAFSVILIFFLNMSFIARPYAISQIIEAESVAKELAAKADGTYVAGDTVMSVEDPEVALPVIDEETGTVLGHIVADREKLISVLNDAGLTEVANALAALEAGTAAGEAVTAGFIGGTTAAVVLGVAALIGIALAAGGGGGDGGTTPAHTPTPAHP